METLKVDRTKLKTFANYAEMKGVTYNTVKNWAKAGFIQTENIDGVNFVKLP